MSPSSILEEICRLASIRKDVHKTSKAIIDHIINAQLNQLKEQLTQMANPNFSAILDDDPADAEAPKGLPVGQYIFLVDGQPKFDKSTKKGTDYVEFTCKPVQAMDSVDQDALNAALERKDGTARVLSDMSMRLTFYLTEDAKYRLSNFMKHCGFDLEGEKKSYSQWISELPGAQFVGTIGQTMSDDGERMYSNITRTAPVEA